MELDADSELTCPLCCEEMDATDRALSLCPCGFSMCLWCFHRIKEDAAKDALPARCPNCRKEYDSNNITMQAISPIELEEMAKKQKRKSDRKPGGSGVRSRQDLGSVRVVQRNLVYVVGLAMEICYDDVLRGSDYFGQFGKPVKVSVNRAMPPGVNGVKNGPSGSAYVTFRRPQEAQLCIESIDGAFWHGRMVRACFGTTKYCNAFLKGVPCNNGDCLYLHAIAEEADSFTKEQMLSGDASTQFVSLTHPPVLKQRAGSMGVHSATASSSISHPVAPPAPGQSLQRSVTMPASNSGPAFGASDPPLGNPTAVSAAAAVTNGPSWAAVSAVHVPQPPTATAPPPPPNQLPADKEWPSLSGPASSSDSGAGSSAPRPDAALAVTPVSTGGPAASGETMAAQLARAKSAPSSAAANSLTRSASGKKLVALSPGQRSWATSKTLVPPPPPLAASTVATAKSSDAAPLTLTLPLPAKTAREVKASKPAAVPAAMSAAAAASISTAAGTASATPAATSGDAAQDNAGSPPAAVIMAEFQSPTAGKTDAAKGDQPGKTCASNANSKAPDKSEAAKPANSAPSSAADMASAMSEQGTNAVAINEVQQDTEPKAKPAGTVPSATLPSSDTAAMPVAVPQTALVQPELAGTAATVATPVTQVQTQPRRPLGPPPGFGPTIARKIPPPGFESPLGRPPAASAPQFPGSDTHSAQVGGFARFGVSNANATPQQQLAASGSALLQQLTGSFRQAPPGFPEAGTRRQSRFSFARVEADNGPPGAATAAGNQTDAQHSQLHSPLGALPGFNHAGNVPLLQQQLAAASRHVSGPGLPDASSGLAPGAALLRQLQASVGGSLHPLDSASAGINLGLNDPGVMAARVNCAAGAPPPGFPAPQSAARSPPPGFAFPLTAPFAGYGGLPAGGLPGNSNGGQVQAQVQLQSQQTVGQAAMAARAVRDDAAVAGGTPPMVSAASAAAATSSAPAEGRTGASGSKESSESAAEEKSAAPMVAASPRSSRGGKKKRGGKGRGGASVTNAG